MPYPAIGSAVAPRGFVFTPGAHRLPNYLYHIPSNEYRNTRAGEFDLDPFLWLKVIHKDWFGIIHNASLPIIEVVFELDFHSLSVDNFLEHSQLEPHIARNQVIVLFHEVGPMTGILVAHQFQSFPHIVNGDMVLGGLGELGKVFTLLCVFIVAVIDHNALAFQQSLGPLVLSALAVIEKTFLGIGLESLDNRPLISIGGNGEKIDEVFVVGGEIFDGKHISWYFGVTPIYIATIVPNSSKA